MRLRITPGQGVYLHGWLAPKLTLSWADVVENRAFTLAHLADAAHIPLSALHQLQPDAAAWIRHGRAGLADCPRMELWAAHPLRDFKADLGELVNQGWSADALARMGVAYDDLAAVGLNAENMGLFSNLTLLGWAQLGFSRAAAAAMSEAALVRLFGMPKQDVLRSLR
jgi:hypothetical protein